MSDTPATAEEVVEEANVLRFLVREMNDGNLDHADAYYAIENYARHRIVPWDAADQFVPVRLAAPSPEDWQAIVDAVRAWQAIPSLAGGKKGARWHDVASLALAAVRNMEARP